MNTQLKGLIITALGVVLIVPDSLFVRVIVADPLVVAFWRSLITGLVIGAGVLVLQGPAGFSQVLRTGWTGVIYVVLLGSTAPGFVMAIAHTSVANVVFILASMPIFATAFSRIFLGEPIRPRMVWTMVAVAAGLAVIAYGSGASEVASLKGDLWALYASAVFAGALTTVRRLKGVSMVPAIPIAAIGAALVMLPLLNAPLQPMAAQWPLFLAHGTFIAAGSCLLALGPRFISSSEVALLILLESVMAPILVWYVVGENPGPWAMAGGGIVIGALMVSNLIALRKQQVQAAR